MRLFCSFLFIAAVSAMTYGQTGGDLGDTSDSELIRTGCLTLDHETNAYVLTEATGRQMVVGGLSELKKHVNRIVKLEGARSTNGRVFQVVVLEQVSPLCSGKVPHHETLTADQQGMSAIDRRMSQTIRQAVVSDRSLSFCARNVKIISRDGVVTLKGPVRSEQERYIVEQKALDVAGPGRVSNELTVQSRELSESRPR